MKIVVDPSKCIGCNLCEDISEGAMVIKSGSDNKASQSPGTDLSDPMTLKKVKLAIETCPMRAIKLVK